MYACPQHGRAFALAQHTCRNDQLQNLLGIARVHNVQHFAQQFLLIGKELDLHLVEIVLVVLGARELSDATMQIGCRTHHRLKFIARRSSVAKQRNGQIQINQVPMIDLQKAQADHNRIPRALICHTAVRAKVISLQCRRIEMHVMI